MDKTKRGDGMEKVKSGSGSSRVINDKSFGHPLKNFFWFCSGASFLLLRRCPTESAKYTSIGGTVFFTGLLAAVSGGFAIYSVFASYTAAFFVGLLWGLMIFNLDRFLVSSMKKQEKKVNEWLMALPRIALAILIAVVIARPLELKIFAPEIASELSLITEERIAGQQSLITARYEPEIENRRLEIIALQQQIAEKAQVRDALAKIAQEEADGTGGSKRRNLGPIYAVKKADAERAQQEFEVVSQANGAIIETLRNETDSLQAARAREIAAIDAKAMAGMALQMEALKRLSQKHEAIRLANIFIMLLFIFIETSPVLVKLLSPRGPYDDLLEAHEHAFVTFKKARIHHLNTHLERKIAWDEGNA